MSAADVTPEMVAYLRKYGVHHHMGDVCDALESAWKERDDLRRAILEYQQAPAAMESALDREIEHLSAELEQARTELDDERERVNVQREDIRALRAQLAAQVVEVPEFDPNALDIVGTWNEHDLRVFLAGSKEGHRALAARLQAGAVDVPEPPDSDLPTANHAVVHQASRVGFRIGVKWARENARLVPAPPQPSADVVVVPREEWGQLRADRDRLASDLQAKTAELGRVRRNHLRNQLKRAELHARVHTQIAKQGSMSTRPMSPKTLRRAARNRDRWRKVVDALRAALATTETGES